MLNKILVLVKRVFVMRFLLVVAFLVFPSVGFSGMGDVYFCESTKLIRLENGEVETFTNEKFKFKRTSDGLIFGSEDGYFKNLELTYNSYDLGSELFSYNNESVDKSVEMVFSYEDGIFTFSQVSFQSVNSLIGKCSVF